jgi:nucleoside 2-deoxyribosyltransferase
MKIFKITKMLSTTLLFIALSHICYAGSGGNNKPLNVFFAGPLFSQKDLIGNLYLAESIERLSSNKYRCFVAQNKVQQNVTHQRIKDQDLGGVIDSDVALFSFDGSELDSGTVVEFMAAKFLDRPSVVYRTDFRGGSGEEAIDEHSNKWNLMASYYPRTKIIYLNAMVEYQKIYEANRDKSPDVVSKKYSDHIARILLAAMEDVLSEAPILNSDALKAMKVQFKKLAGIAHY